MHIKTFTYGDLPIEFWELPALLLSLLAVYVVGGLIKRRGIRRRPEYKYFLFGMWAKIFGGIGFACIYLFYYGQGDTNSYYECALAFKNLFFHDLPSFLQAYFGDGSMETKSLFTADTGEPMWYMFRDDKTRFVIKLVTPFLIVSGGSYFITTLLISIVTYGGLWRLYLMFTQYFPDQSRNLAIAILFMPSVIFWGSGIMKDSFTLAATCYFIVATNRLVIREGVMFFNIIQLMFWGAMVLGIKAYIIIILLPGTLIWFFYDRILRIRNRFFRIMVVPITYALVIGGSYATLGVLGESLGKFNLEHALETATVIQRDLKRDYYEGNSFDIGDFDPTFTGVLSKFPQATIAGLYRPFIWESNNVVMLLSGLENMFVLGLTLLVIFSLKRKVLVAMITRHPVILYCTIFSILFAFMIGITTSNFGALVRFRIPLIPLYMSCIMVMYGYLDPIRFRRRSRKIIVGA